MRPIPLSLRLGNKLYHRAFWLYRPLYAVYKRWTDRHERALIRRAVRPGMTVVDVGSNIGSYLSLLARLVGPSGRVFAFEPDPENYRRLQSVAARFPQVEAVQAAVSDRTGTLTFYLSDDLNVDHRSYDPGEDRSEMTVPSFRLDDYLGNEIRVDFIKMDIQGAEWFALQGMKDVLARSPGVKLLFEFWPEALEQAAGDALKPVEFLEERGFRIDLLEDSGRVEFDRQEVLGRITDYGNLYAYRPTE